MTEQVKAADAEIRARALDPECSFIVQAPAGSGKTELLIQRFLTLLARVEAPEEIVAITFTRKAAREMRNRIMQALRRVLDATYQADSEHQKLTLRLAQAVYRRDTQLAWGLFEHPSRLRVQTIDALCASIARQMPLTSGMGAPPGVAEDALPLYLLSARRTLEGLNHESGWSKSIERLLLHLGNDQMQLEQMLARMLARRDQWMRHLLGGETGLQRDSLQLAMRELVEEEIAALRALIPQAEAAEIVALARYAAENLVVEQAQSPLLACHELEALPAAHEGQAWRGLMHLLVAPSSGEWRKRCDVKMGFPAPGGSKDKAEKARREEMKKRFAALLESLSEHEDILHGLRLLAILPDTEYTDAQWQILEALFELLPLAVAQLRLVFIERGEADFVEIMQAAHSALGEEQAPTDLALAMDYRIRHLLVDEFQDTSLNQYILLEKLTAGWQPDDGRSLFLVGDPMQSIYRFREAEVGLYLRARRDGIGGVPLEALNLSVNFRSTQGVVDWVNQGFTRIMPEREDVATGAVSYAPSIAWHAHEGGQAVSVHAFVDDDGEGEARRVLELIEQTRRENEKASIAILVRGRGHLLNILPLLNEAGHRYRAVDIERLDGRPVVQDLLSLTRALLHPADRVAWLAILRAPWCGLTLNDMYALSTDAPDAPAATLWQLLCDETRLAALSEDGRRRLARVTPVLSEALRHARRRDLRGWIEATWLALGGPACMPPADAPNAQAYLELLESLDHAGEVEDLNELEIQVAGLYAKPDPQAGDELQIMTIHKSKGLEFDCVIVPGLGRRPRTPENPLLLWWERPRGHEQSDLLLAPIREAGGEHERIYAYLKQIDAEKTWFEDTRLLYVAATRARGRLHLLGNVGRKNNGEGVREPAGGSLLKHLWPLTRESFEAVAAADEQDGEAKPAARNSLLTRLPLDWRAPPAPAPVPLLEAQAAMDVPERMLEIEYDWAGAVAMHVGTVVHRLLQQIAHDGLAAWNDKRIDAMHDTLVNWLRELGVPRYELQDAAARAAGASNLALRDPKGIWVLSNAHEDARNEYALTAYRDGAYQSIVIDRTFIDANGVRWIIDYKTSRHEGRDLEAFLDREQERYREQLERYAEFMRAKEDRVIKCGLYFPLLRGWREWQP